MPVHVSERGNWQRTINSLQRLKSGAMYATLSKYGDRGVTALSAATPVESNLTAQSWTYTIVQRKGYYSIRWSNGNHVDGVPVAVLLQYGHATGNGGYIEGQDYIMPAIRPIFDQILAELRKEVTK